MAQDAAGPANAAADAPILAEKIGKLISVSAPITSTVIDRVILAAKKFIVEAKRNGQWPVVVFEIEPGKSRHGAALDLATQIAALDGASTVAFIGDDIVGKPQTLRGHAVLVAIACEMIVMAPDCKIGDAGADEATINQHVRSSYTYIAKTRHTAPVDLVLGMLDPDVEVWEVQTADVVTREFVRSDRLEELRKEKTFVLPERPLIPAGEVGLFRGEQARALGIVRYLAHDRSSLARQLGLPRDALEPDPWQGDVRRAVEFPIRGPLTAKQLGLIQGKIRKRIELDDINLIVLSIDSAGGAPQAALALANYLAGLNPAKRRTVAYIAKEARGDAAFLAIACDNIVMHPDAVLGGPVILPRGKSEKVRREELDALLISLDEISDEKGRSRSLVRALHDRKITVYKYTRTTGDMHAYYSEAEAEALSDSGQWQKGPAITEAGKVLKLDGEKARQLGLARDVVAGFAGLKTLYSLEQDPERVEPDWSDTLLGALANPAVLWGLLMIGGAAFYMELHTPGVGVGGFVATLCFLLYFWGTYLDGTAGWLEMLLFLVGMVFILMEVFVFPGFGICGLGGGLMIVASLVLAMQTFNGIPTSPKQIGELRGSLFVVTSAAVGIAVLISVARKYLPHTPGFDQIMLEPPAVVGSQTRQVHQEALARYDHLLGKKGSAATQLTPAGKANLDGQLVDVLTNGEVVDRGQKIVVVQVQGNRIVVRADSA